jgi:hypothetical protein
MSDTSLVCDKNILVVLAYPDDTASFTAVRFQKENPQVVIRAYFLIQKNDEVQLDLPFRR